MRPSLVLGLSALVFACGSPTETVSPTPPATTASVAPVVTPPPPPIAAAPPTAEPAPAAAPCGGKCPGRVGPALVDAIAKRAKQAHRCYDNALATDKTLRGKVTVRMMIGADGRVCEVTADTDNKGMEAVASCVAGFYRTTGQFPPPDNGCAVVNAPINFVPRPSDAGAP